MSIVEDNRDLIMKELTKIAYAADTSDLLFIDDRRSFAKTPVFQKLRKGELTNEDLSFMFKNFVFEGDELINFILKFIKDLTLSKFLDIGGLDYMIQHRNYDSGRVHNLIINLLENLKIENPEEEVRELLDCIEASSELKYDKGATYEITLYIINKLIEVDAILDRSEIETIILKTLQTNYEQLFNIISNTRRYSSSRTFYRRPYFLSSSRHDFTRLIEIISRADQEEAEKFLTDIFNMPYLDFKEVKEFIKENKDFETRTKLIILYASVLSCKYIPTDSIMEDLAYIENLHQKEKSEEKIKDLFYKAGRYAHANLEVFGDRVVRDMPLDSKVRQIFFEKYYAEPDIPIEFGSHRKQLKMLVDLNLGDKYVSNYIGDLLERGLSAQQIIHNFECNPKDRSTYPGPLTLKTLIGRGYKDLFLWHSPDPIDVIARMDESNRVKTIFKHYLNKSLDLPITWRMANDPKFIRHILQSLNHQHRNKIEYLEKINFKGFGFTKYMRILEDLTREIDNKVLGETIPDLSKRKYVYRDIPEVLLEEATESELYMYKYKIAFADMLQSANCPMSIIRLYLKAYHKLSPYHRLAYFTREAIIRGYSVNKNLTKEERIEILIGLGYHGDTRLSFHLPGEEQFTVADFVAYYEKVRG